MNNENINANTTGPNYQNLNLSFNVVKQVDFLLLSHIPIFVLILCFSILLLCITLKKGFARNSHCLIFIAVEAILNTGRQCIYAIYSLVGIFVPSGLMPFRLCCGLIQPINIFMNQSSGICMLMIASDRLCAILAPTWYFRWSQRKVPYFVAFISLSLAISSTRLVDGLMTVYYFTGENKGVVCQTTPCGADFIVGLYTKLNSIYYGITLAAYLTFFIVYHWKLPKVTKLAKHDSNQSQRQKQFSETARIHSALVVLCVCYSLGMLNNWVALAIQWHWIFADLSPAGFGQLSSIYILTLSLVNLCYTPLLFTFSSKYRNALKKMDNNFCYRCCCSNRLQQQQCHNHPRHQHQLQLTTKTNNTDRQAMNGQTSSMIQRIKCQTTINPTASASILPYGI